MIHILSLVLSVLALSIATYFNWQTYKLNKKTRAIQERLRSLDAD